MSTQVQLTATPESGPNPPEQNTPPVDPNRPAWLPPEFQTVEAYNASYAELRADHTRKSQELARLRGEQTPPEETPNEPPKETPKETPKPNTPPTPPKIEEKKEGEEKDPAEAVSEAAGFDLNPYQEEYFSTGDVSEEARGKIADGLKGILGDNARQIVDQYIEGQKNTHANDRQLYFDEAGGQDAYNGMITWAATSLPKEEVAAFNRAIDSGDRHSTLLAIRGLRAQHEAQNGRVPNNIRPSGGSTPSAISPFNSAAEMTAAMRDTRYKTDEAYRANVAARIAASPNL